MSYTDPDFEGLVDDFAAGFLDTPQSHRIPPGSTPEAKNGLLRDVDDGGRAIVVKRPGSRLVQATALALGKKVDAVFEFRRAGQSPQLLAVCNGALYRREPDETFTAVPGGTGLLAGTVVRFLPFKDHVLLSDGIVILIYDGSTCTMPGLTAPAGAPTLAAFGGGTVTGDYEGFVVWYYAPRDHESSPSPVSGVGTFTNQQREWTQPAAPPALATHWRIYCRRDDTDEANFFRVATVPIAQTVYREQVADTLRVDLGPATSSNDVPSAFAVLTDFRDYAVGVAANGSELHFSKRGDRESWHPKDVFPVAKGDGEAIASVTRYGEECLIFKPHRAWRLEGDRLPFRIVDLHSTFGNVSQESAVEVRGRLYGWDRDVGPYVTDTVNWVALGDRRIRRTLATVSAQYVHDIRAAHVPDLNLIVWAVPTHGQSRKRTILLYHYLLDRWLPPMTGLEYASLTTFTTQDGRLGLYAGDEWGRLFELLTTATNDGVPSGTVQATVTAATTTTVTASAAAFLTTGDGLAGLPVAVRSADTGEWQWRRVASNTATQVTLDTVHGSAFATAPVAGDTVIVGGIEWVHWTPVIDYGKPKLYKTGRFLYAQAIMRGAAHTLETMLRFDGATIVAVTLAFTFAPTGGVWGQGQWGAMRWAAARRGLKKRRVGRGFFTAQIGVRNFYPDQPVELVAIGLDADRRGGRLA